MKITDDIVRIDFAGTILLLTVRGSWNILETFRIMGMITDTISEAIYEGRTIAFLINFVNADIFDDEKNVKRIINIFRNFFREMKEIGLRRLIYIFPDSDVMDEQMQKTLEHMLLPEDLKDISYIITNQYVRIFDEKGSKYCVYAKVCPDYTNSCQCEFDDHEERNPEIVKQLKEKFAVLLMDIGID